MVNNSLGNPLVRAAVRTVLAGSALVATFGVAMAQEATTPPPPASNSGATQQLQEVVVTGSLIATPNQVSLSPVTFVSANAIAQTGVTRVEDMLNRLPQVFASQGSNVVNGSDGTATVDLRDLGAQRTLVLIDGQRMLPGDPRTGGAADLNMIPTALISSVEILTGGASSIYGADAAAGVVNFKLDQHFQGVKLVVDGGIYQHDNSGGATNAINTFNTKYGTNFAQAPSSVWTGAQKELSFIAGFNTPDGNGNATFYATYRNVNSILQTQYSSSACTLASGYIGSGSNFSCAGSSNGYPGRFISATGDNSINLATGGLIPYSKQYAFNYGPLNYYQRPDERYTAGAFLHYTLNEHATAYASTMFMDDESLAQIAPSGAFLGPAYTVNCANPFLSASELTGWCGGSTTGNASLYIGRRNIEGGNRVDDLEHTEFREVIGVKGAINDNWTYDANYQYGFTSLSETYLNDLSVTKIQDALNVINVGGTAECVSSAPVSAGGLGLTNGLGSGCVPWNIFGHGGALYMDPGAAAPYLATPLVQRGKIQQTIVQLGLTGDLGRYVTSPLANSGLKVAVGGDYRDEKSFTQPDEEYQTGDGAGQGGATLPVAGDLVVREGYVEGRMPLISDKPFAKSIDIDASYRYSGYSAPNGATKGFSTNTFAASLAWRPSNDYRFRASFARAVRAPNIGELYSARSVALDGATDPCSGAAPSYTPAQCAQTGVPTTAYGTVLAAPAAQYNGLLGGNPSLQPETALTTSAGFGWTPSYVPSLRVQVDYYDIKIENVIERIGADEILKLCLNSDLMCSSIHRGPLYSLWLQGGYVSDTQVNAGQLEEKGVDIDAGYNLHLGHMGMLNTSLVGTYITSYLQTPIQALASTGYNCIGYYGPTCGEPIPHWRHTLRFTWTTPWDGMSLSAAWRFISPVNLEYLSPNPSLGTISGGASVANGQISNTDAHLPSESYLDLTASVALPSNIDLRLGVNNVLDKQPPLIGASDLPLPYGNGNTFPEVYDSLGRYLFAELSVQF